MAFLIHSGAACDAKPPLLRLTQSSVIALASCMAFSVVLTGLFGSYGMGFNDAHSHGTACRSFFATASTFGVCGSACSAQPDSQIRQAESSTIVFFVVFAVLTLLISFWRRGAQQVRRNILQRKLRSHQARMVWLLRATICRPAPSLGYRSDLCIRLDGMFLAASYLASMAYRLVSCCRTAPPWGSIRSQTC